MSLAEVHRSLARSLPIRLQKFFALNPPRLMSASTVPLPSAASTQSTENALLGSTESPRKSRRGFNPFQPHKNPKTGNWNPPIYSLRRQAELAKLARNHGVEDLLPFTVKNSQVRAAQRIEHGLRVKGTGVGQRVKGHEWERTLKGRLEKRRQAMLEMPKLIHDWKQRGHGRGFTKWPK